MIRLPYSRLMPTALGMMGQSPAAQLMRERRKNAELNYRIRKLSEQIAGMVTAPAAKR